MEPRQDISSQSSGTPSAKDMLQKVGHSHLSASKHMQTFTKVELATLFGVGLSELGKLARMGVLRRIGIDKYLLDCHQTAVLLGRRKRAFHPGVSAGDWQTLPSGALGGAGSVTGDQNRHQKLTELLRRHNGLLENSVNIVKVPDLPYAILTAGMFLEEGLLRNERVAVLSFEHPEKLLLRFAETGHTFDDALQTEQLIYLYYKPDVARSICLSMDYRELFGEVVRLGGENVHRMVLFNVDALINANSEHLVHTSLHQLIFAANHYQVTLMGLFVASGHVAGLLDEGCRAILPGYFVMD